MSKSKPKRMRITVRWHKADWLWWISDHRDTIQTDQVPGVGFTDWAYINKLRAVRHARKLARNSQPSQLVIFGKNGRIQTEHTYGADPERTKG